jgi:hypothetical protein
MLKPKVGAALLIGFLSATTASQADSVSYFLDQSNTLADGINYLQVTISDERAAGVIDFKVEALQPLIDLAGDGFGIDMFAFNVLGGVGAEARNVGLLPEDWRARNGGRMDGFGLYDITTAAGIGKGHDDADKKNGNGHDYYFGRDRDSFGRNGKGYGHGNGPNVQQPLTFSIAGVSLDTIFSYIDLSTGLTPEGFSLFSARVTGLNLGDCDVAKSSGGGSSGGTCDTRSAYFGGVNPVPAPPAIWLLGTAIVGLVVRRLRSGRAIATA